MQQNAKHVNKIMRSCEKKIIKRLKTNTTNFLEISPMISQNIKKLSEIPVPDTSVDNNNYFLHLPLESKFYVISNI